MAAVGVDREEAAGFEGFHLCEDVEGAVLVEVVGMVISVQGQELRHHSEHITHRWELATAETASEAQAARWGRGPE